MATFRSNFLQDGARIPKLIGRCEADIRSAYRGGTVSLFKPKMGKGYVYDMNSQYPAAMLKDMPVGQPIRCYRPKLSDFFGFVKVNVRAPIALYKPFLTVAGPEGKVISPLGEWTGWYFSEELKKAVDLGYTIEPLEGYRFERGVDIFKGYVEHFYERKRSAATAGLKLISKLQLNGFYGR